MGLPVRDDDRHTYGDYLTWGEDERYELIDGTAYLMAPAPSLAHQEVAGEIYRQAANALADSPCRPYVAPVDVRLPAAHEADERIDTVLQPEVLVVCDERKLDRRGVRGAPDWVVEVLSPATAGHDQVHKRRVYEHHGVRELWLVHPNDRIVTIYRLGEGDRLGEGEYGKPEVQELAGETPVGVLPDVSIRWDDLVARLPEPTL